MKTPELHYLMIQFLIVFAALGFINYGKKLAIIYLISIMLPKGI